METRIKIYIAQTLRSARKQKGFTQEDLGERIGRTAESLSNIERGKAIPSIETLVSLAMALELPLRAFFPDLEQKGEPTPKRLHLEAKAVGIIRMLPEKSLETAIDQLHALSKLSA